jgi:hypothetical protein
MSVPDSGNEFLRNSVEFHSFAAKHGDVMIVDGRLPGDCVRAQEGKGGKIVLVDGPAVAKNNL